MYWKTRKLNTKRKKRIERLMQKFGLLHRREEIERIWGWNARRHAVHAMAHA